MFSISVITPVYNSIQHIEQCIQNVISQQCKEVEHVIVDGGSTDGTAGIIQQYATQYPHIKWLSEKDRGQSDAMNKGIDMAQGEFIGFLNVDDAYDPGVLGKVSQIIRFDHLPMSTLLLGNVRQVDEKGSLLYIRKPDSVSLSNVLQFWKMESFPANPVSYFYHKKLHEMIGYYDIYQHYTMDYDFFLRASAVVHVKYYDEIWGTYKMLPGAKTVEIGRKGGTRHLKEKLFFKYIPSLSFGKQLVLIAKFVINYKSKVWKKTLRRYYHRFKTVVKKIFKVF